MTEISITVTINNIVAADTSETETIGDPITCIAISTLHVTDDAVWEEVAVAESVCKTFVVDAATNERFAKKTPGADTPGSAMRPAPVVP